MPVDRSPQMELGYVWMVLEALRAALDPSDNHQQLITFAEEQLRSAEQTITWLQSAVDAKLSTDEAQETPEAD